MNKTALVCSTWIIEISVLGYYLGQLEISAIRDFLVQSTRSCFLFLQLLRWFNSLGTRWQPNTISQSELTSVENVWGSLTQVSPFGHPRVKAWLPAHRGLSQAPTSFIGIFRQGILCTPFVVVSTEILSSKNKIRFTFSRTQKHLRSKCFRWFTC